MTPDLPALIRAGQADAAAADPIQADAWFNLGWLHRNAHRLEAALNN